MHHHRLHPARQHEPYRCGRIGRMSTTPPPRSALLQQLPLPQVPGRTDVTPLPSWRRLVEWVESSGGYVDPRLQLTTGDAPCGSRGVVATASITQEDLVDAPLIVVPQSLYMTTEDASTLLLRHHTSPTRWWDRMLAAQQQQQQQELPAAARLALLLAHERKQGRASRWSPYIASLPPHPPSAWLMDPAQLQDSLEGLGVEPEPWMHAVKGARTAMDRLAGTCIERFGRQLELSEADVLWALGQVLSRAFGSDERLAMAPLIDLLNHREGAATPQAFQQNDLPHSFLEQQQQQQQQKATTELTEGPVHTCWFVTSLSNEQPLALSPGDELCISYISKHGSAAALNSFLNFGFVPAELQVPRSPP